MAWQTTTFDPYDLSALVVAEHEVVQQDEEEPQLVHGNLEDWAHLMGFYFRGGDEDEEDDGDGLYDSDGEPDDGVGYDIDDLD